MGAIGCGGIGGSSGAGSAAVSAVTELRLFSDAAVMFDVSSESFAVVADDMAAAVSSSDVVKSMASPSALTTEDLSSSTIHAHTHTPV